MLSSQNHNSQSKAMRDLVFFLKSIFAYISYMLQEVTSRRGLAFKWSKSI